MACLQGHRNKYDGMFIPSTNLPDSDAQFEQQLAESLKHWQNEKVKVVWLPFQSHQAHLIPTAIAQGFSFHHCYSHEVLLIKALRNNATIPSFASHTVGVGGIVINADRAVLTVVEQQDAQKRPNYFKFPGGMLEKHEDIATGIVREILEETSIQTTFSGIVNIRHHHFGQFGTSNLYVVCMLEPNSFDIEREVAEIARAQWMPIDAFLANRHISTFNKHLLACALNSQPLTSQKIEGYHISPSDYEIFTPLK